MSDRVAAARSAVVDVVRAHAPMHAAVSASGLEALHKALDELVSAAKADVTTAPNPAPLPPGGRSFDAGAHQGGRGAAPVIPPATSTAGQTVISPVTGKPAQIDAPEVIEGTNEEREATDKTTETHLSESPFQAPR